MLVKTALSETARSVTIVFCVFSAVFDFFGRPRSLSGLSISRRSDRESSDGASLAFE